MSAEDTRAVRGTVTHSASRFTRDGSRVVTESSIVQADGTVHSVIQLGGDTAEGGQIVHGGPPLLRAGDEVDLRVRPSQSLRGDQYLTLAEVVQLKRAPEPRPKPGELSLEYAPTLTKETQKRLYWASGCIFLTYDSEGTEDIEGDLEFDVMDQVFANWQSRTEACSYMRFVLEGRRPMQVTVDRVNVIKFVTGRWCTPATEDAPEQCHWPEAIAMTNVRYIKPPSKRVAEIVDVDIELNNVHYSFGADGTTLGAGVCAVDLANVLTHEVGHLLGIAHTCLMPKDDPNTLDDQGNPLLSCQSPYLAAEARSSTMYGESTGCGDTSLTTLEDDDVRAVCELMPVSADPGECSRPASLKKASKEDGCGCSIPGENQPLRLPGLALLSLGGLVALGRRRLGPVRLASCLNRGSKLSDRAGPASE